MLVGPPLRRYLVERAELGRQRYGVPLGTGNGRDALRDAFEEAVDLVQYLAQALLERDGALPPGNAPRQPAPTTVGRCGVEELGTSTGS